MRHAVIILLALLSIGLLVAALAPAQETPVDQMTLAQYRLSQVEKRVDAMVAEHNRLTALLVSNLVAVVISLGVYIATYLRRRNGRGNGP